MSLQGVAPCWVAGASGYTGRAVVAELRRLGLATVAHVRPDSRDRAALERAFTALGATVDVSPWQAAALQAALQRHRPGVVFGLLGTTRARAAEAKRQGRDPEAESYDAIDVGLTLMLLGASKMLAEAGAPPTFVYLSSLGADRPGPSGYLQARARVEAEVRASGLPFVIARPAAITGDDRAEPRPLERFFARGGDLALDGLAALGAGGLRARFASMDAATLAAGLVRAALDPSQHGRALDAAWLRAGVAGGDAGGSR